MNILKKYRDSSGFSQRQLAEKSGVNIRQVQKYESGEYDIRNMTLKNAVALADALQIDARKFLEEK